MIYAVRAGGYYHGGNKPEINPDSGSHPFYVAMRQSAPAFWTNNGARRLIEASHRAHRANFAIEPVWLWWVRRWRGEVV